MLFFANGRADRESYIDAFHLSEIEYETVRQMPPERRAILVKQSAGSVLIDARIQDDATRKVFSGTAESVKHMDAMRAEYGPDWLGEYLMTSLNGPSHAGGVPTFDSATLSQLTQHLVKLGQIEGVNAKQLATLVSQLTTLRDQLQVIEDQYAAITGARDAVATLFKGNLDEAQIAITLEKLRNLSGVSETVKARYAALDQTFEFVDGKSFYGAKTDTPRSRVYDLEQRTVKTEIVVSEQIFEDAATAFAHYETYRETLASSETNKDLKAAIDLNTRVAIENGENLAKLMQMIAVQSQSNGVMCAARCATHTCCACRTPQKQETLNEMVDHRSCILCGHTKPCRGNRSSPLVQREGTFKVV